MIIKYLLSHCKINSSILYGSALVTALLLITANANAQPECGYEVVIIHPNPCGQLGPPAASARGLNSFGHLAGHRSRCSDGYSNAISWMPETGMVDLEMPEDAFRSQALDVNDDGWSVGWVEIPGDELGSLGFLHDGETAILLGTLPGGNWSEARAINNAGLITGFWGNNITGPWQAFIWQDGEMSDLGAIIGGISSRAFAINEDGAVTGRWRENAKSERMAFIWDDGKFTSLGAILGGFTSEGHDISDNGYVVGWGWKFDEHLQENVGRAFFWSDGVMIDLGVLPDRTVSWATA